VDPWDATLLLSSQYEQYAADPEVGVRVRHRGRDRGRNRVRARVGRSRASGLPYPSG